MDGDVKYLRRLFQRKKHAIRMAKFYALEYLLKHNPEFKKKALDSYDEHRAAALQIKQFNKSRGTSRERKKSREKLS